MASPDYPALRQQLQHWLQQHADDCLTYTEVHGFLAALACAPRLPPDWSGAISESGQLPDQIEQILERLRERLAAQLGAGEGIQLPCRLDPEEDREGEDLASWCAGFIIAVTVDEAVWHDAAQDNPQASEEEDSMARMLLPFLLISGLDEDPALDQLWQQQKLVAEMARGIPDLVEELFLHFHAPGLGSAEDGADSNEGASV